MWQQKGNIVEYLFKTGIKLSRKQIAISFKLSLKHSKILIYITFLIILLTSCFIPYFSAN
jgi:hypothetical protein